MKPQPVERALEVLAAEAKSAGVVVDVEQSPFAALDVLRANASANASAGGLGGLTLALAAMLGERLVERFGAFWFPQRECALGAVGFSHVLLAIDPVALVDAAVKKRSLAELDARVRELEWQLQGMTPATVPLAPAEYGELFDPGLVQFLVVDTGIVERACALEGNRVTAALNDALREANLDPAVRESLERAWLTSAAIQARSVELFVRMAAAVASGAPADESFWADIAFRLLPPSPAGARLLGVFNPDHTHPVVTSATPRLFLVDAADLGTALEDVHGPARGDIIDTARARLVELRALVQQVSSTRSLAFRRMTVSEAASEAAVASVSRSLAQLALD